MARDGDRLDPYRRDMSTQALVIRSLEQRPDAAGLLAVWLMDEWPEYHRGRSLPDVASQFRLVSDVQQALIAEIETEVVGTVAVRGRWEAVPELSSPWLGGLFVVPEHRGQGIGTALVEAAITAATVAGHPIVHMAVRVDPAFYIRRDWRVVGTVAAGDECVTVLRFETGS